MNTSYWIFTTLANATQLYAGLSLPKKKISEMPTPSSLGLRYMVYLAEIRKRLVYIGVSLFSAWLCAYTQRVPLMYCITLSLQKAFSGTGKPKDSEKGWHFGEGNPLEKRIDQPLSDSIGVGLEPIPKPALLGDSLVGSGDSVVRLIFTDVEEAFYTLLYVSLFWCFYVCLPVLIYHILCFLQPGFHAWQSIRVWFFVCTRLSLLYALLKAVDLLVIPQLLSFFYSFQINRSSLSLYAETKVVSYVSLYVFVCCITVILLLVTGLWGFYRQRKMLNLFAAKRLPAQHPADHVLPARIGIRDPQLDYSVNATQLYGELRSKTLELENGTCTTKYKDQRGKVWWGCLLLSALISPPEISSQLVCACLLVTWSEIGIWLGYTSVCRLWVNALQNRTV